MNSPTLRRLLVISLLALMVVPVGVSARIKCWTNKEGVRECGNRVPPEYAQKGHQEISKHGITTKRQQRARTAAELEVEKQKQIELAEEKRKAREQAAHDRVLLDTFTTAKELEMARDSKIEVIDARIAHTRNRIDRLEQNRGIMQKEAARQERSGKPASEKLQHDIQRVDRQVKENHGFVVEREQEKKDVDAQFERDLKRYRQLKQRRH